MSGFNATGGPQSIQQNTLERWMNHIYPEQSNALDGQILRSQAQSQAQGRAGKSSRQASLGNGQIRRERGNSNRNGQQARQPNDAPGSSVQTRYRREGALKDDTIEGSSA